MNGGSKTLAVLVIGLAAVLMCACVAVSTLSGTYNGLVNNDVYAKNKLGDVHSAYQRQADVIKLNAEVLRASASQQRAIADRLVDQAAALSGNNLPTDINGTPVVPSDSNGISNLQQQYAAFDKALGDFLVYVADNPEGIGDISAYKDLMTQVEGGENRKNVARMDYNEAAGSYEASCRTFPTVLMAGMFGFDCYKWAQFTADAGLTTPDFNLEPEAK